MKRISLNGEWQVIYDYDNKGRLLGLHKHENFMVQQAIEYIPVPSCLEEHVQDYEGTAWYHRDVFVPNDDEGKRFRLCFDAVNYRSEVWVNGFPIGMHEGGYVGFEYDVTDYINFGSKNHIIVRVITPIITRDVIIDGLARDEAPHWRAAIAGGIWQDVYFKITGNVYITDLFINPNIHDANATVSMTLNNMSMEYVGISLNISASLKGSDIALERITKELTAEPGINNIQLTYDMPNFSYWSFDEPNLYNMDIEIMDKDNVSQQLTQRFGMREFTINDKSFYLNGEKVIIKAAFYEGLYPHSLAYPRDIEVLRKTLQNSKDAGLNLIRPWRKPQPPIVYEMADEMGLMFIGALPVECMEFWPRLTPSVFDRIDDEIESMIKRDRNHPSIIMWEMFNEIIRTSLKNYKHKASLIARYNDPDRIILDEAGGFAGGASLYMPRSKTPTVINDVHNYPGAPLDKNGYDKFLMLAKTKEEIDELGLGDVKNSWRSIMQPELLTNISEIGYGSIPNLTENMQRYIEEGNPLTPDYRLHERLYNSYNKVLKETGVMDMYGSLKEFTTACQTIHSNGNKLMVEACRMNSSIGGIMVHALTGGDWVVGAGLLDIFGDPKLSYYGTKKAFSDRYISIRTSKPNLFKGEDMDITLAYVNDKDEILGELELCVIDENGSKTDVLAGKITTLEKGINTIDTYTIDTESLQGMCKVMAVFKVDGEVITDNETKFYIVEKEYITHREISVIEDTANIQTYAKNKGIPVVDFSKDNSMDTPLFLASVPDNMDDVNNWVESGGTAIINDFPEGIINKKDESAGWVISDYLPFDVETIDFHDLWSPSNHIARKHTVFDGLPTECMMDIAYRELRPKKSITNITENWIAGAIYYRWYARQAHKQNYYGVNAAEHGADLIEVKHGKGKYILCTFRISNSITSDAMTQTMFNNLLSWV